MFFRAVILNRQTLILGGYFMCRKGQNIYYRKDERWESRYHKGRKANGRIKYGYVYGKSFEDVQEKLRPLKKVGKLP